MEKIKILVVDDEKDICDLTRRFLEKRDFNVSTAQNGQEAIDAVKKENPRLVLLDIRLGLDSGLDVLRQIKEIDKNIKVIMVTAMDDADNIRQAKSLGADDYMAKPFSADFLSELLLERISRFKLQQVK